MVLAITRPAPSQVEMHRVSAPVPGHLTERALRNSTLHQLLHEAGLCAGMKVLVSGRRAREAALVVSVLVGPEGMVVGLDSAATPDPVAVQDEPSFANVRFFQGSTRDVPLPDDFDAVVGVYALVGMPNAADELQRLVSHVRPGGIIIFQELGPPSLTNGTGPVSRAQQLAASLSWTGHRLYDLFLAARLDVPVMSLHTPSGGVVDWAAYDYGADSLRAVLPLLQQHDHGDTLLRSAPTVGAWVHRR